MHPKEFILAEKELPTEARVGIYTANGSPDMCVCLFPPDSSGSTNMPPEWSVTHSIYQSKGAGGFRFRIVDNRTGLVIDRFTEQESRAMDELTKRLRQHDNPNSPVGIIAIYNGRQVPHQNGNF